MFTYKSHLHAVPTGGTGQVGNMSLHQYRICVNKDTGELDPAGVIPKQCLQICVKYDTSVQGCYSDIMPTINGKETFDYTGKMFVSARMGDEALKKNSKECKMQWGTIEINTMG